MGKDEGEAVRSPRMLLQREKKKRVQDQSPGSGKRKKINGFQEDGTRSRQRRDLAAEDRVLPAEAVSPAERPGKVRCWLGHQEAADWSPPPPPRGPLGTLPSRGLGGRAAGVRPRPLPAGF